MSGPVIVVDDAIAWAAEAFGPMGRVVALPGTAIDRHAVAEADALVVRTVTRVDAALVAGSRLRFVGTATAGIDHVDVDALAQADIRFASAAGCNAHAVADYVVTALHILALERDPSLLAGPCAIVGFGHVGRRLAVRLRALGAEVRVCDPPLQRAVAEGRLDPARPWDRLAIDEPFMPLRDAVADARVLTTHVPLVRGGLDATHGLVGRDVLDALGRAAVVIHTSRGDVVDERALAAWLDHRSGRAVLDVWSSEPEIDPNIVLHPRVRLATPHIAGYSLEGKLAGTTMIAAALADHLGVTAPWRGDGVTGAPIDVEVPAGPSDLARVAACLRRANPIERDDAALRALARTGAPRRAGFEALRRHYAWRRALGHLRVDASAPPTLVAAGLGSKAAGSGHAPALVLVAHGSPDPDWRVPLDAVLARVRADLADRDVALAFLDHLTPSLDRAVTDLETAGHLDVRVIPVFLSPGGGHIKRDIPALCARVAEAHPRVRIELVPGAIGAESDVIEAIAVAVARVGRI